MSTPKKTSKDIDDLGEDLKNGLLSPPPKSQAEAIKPKKRRIRDPKVTINKKKTDLPQHIIDKLEKDGEVGFTYPKFHLMGDEDDLEASIKFLQRAYPEQTKFEDDIGGLYLCGMSSGCGLAYL